MNTVYIAINAFICTILINLIKDRREANKKAKKSQKGCKTVNLNNVTDITVSDNEDGKRTVFFKSNGKEVCRVVSIDAVQVDCVGKDLHVRCMSKDDEMHEEFVTL